MSDDVTVHYGDALDVLAGMPDASVDAVVTDPPYGLEFMGKQWDRLGDIGQASHQGISDGSFKGFTVPQSYNASANVKCQRCSRWKWDHEGRKCECGPDAVYPNVRAHQARAMQDWHHAWAVECLRLLKPGGHLLAFGGTRTFHRLACAIEDAGFEIRDTISWLYGSGFPKSLDVSKAIDRAAGAEREVVGQHSHITPRRTSPQSWGDLYRWGDKWLTWDDLPPQGRDYYIEAGAKKGQITAPATDDARRWQGWGTALKPAWEPVIVARKPLTGTIAANVLAHGTGALNIAATRIDMGDEFDPSRMQRQSAATAGMSGLGESGYAADHEQPTYNAAGRWPANVVLDEDAAALLDRQSGERVSGTYSGKRNSDKFRDSYGEFKGTDADRDAHPGSRGGASRFYYTAKAAPDERPRVNGVSHPTVKPLELMRWLVRLVTPPGGLVLDPFAGSGTTGEACIIEGFRAVLIEREADYLPLIEARLNKPIQPVLGGTP